MPRPKRVRQEAEVTVWPSSFPDDNVGSIAPADSSLDSDELGSHFLSDRAEHGHGNHSQWEEEVDEPYFDEQMGKDLLREFGLAPLPKRTTTRPIAHPTGSLPKLKAPRMPKEFQHMQPSNDVDLTEDATRDASLLDHEGSEPGEVESPRIVTDDVRRHGKPRRGGLSVRPAGLKK